MARRSRGGRRGRRRARPSPPGGRRRRRRDRARGDGRVAQVALEPLRRAGRGSRAARGARRAAARRRTRTWWPAREQRVDDVRADEPGAAGDEDRAVHARGSLRSCNPLVASRRVGSKGCATSSSPCSTSARRCRGCSAACPPATRRSSSTTARPTAPARWPRGSARSVVREPRRGFGAACWAGLRGRDGGRRLLHGLRRVVRPARAAARRRARSRAARADLVLGARAARAGRLAGARARSPTRLLALGAAPPHAACRCATSARCAPRGASRCSRSASRDRRFGWPLEMVLRAAAAGWRIDEVARRLPPARGPLEGDRDGARHGARGARHGGGARDERRRCS